VRPSPSKKLIRAKMDWSCGSNTRVPPKKKKKKKKKGII
jgi:hypothetical protein